MKTLIYSALCIVFSAAIVGCSTADANPTSRATTATYGDVGHEIKIVIEEKAGGNTINLTLPIDLGDGAFASADSKGSNETTSPTLTPTTDIKPDIDVNYAQGGSASSGGATGTSATGILESLTSQSFKTLRDYLTNGTSGTVTLTNKDGTTSTVECKDGTCSINGVSVSKSDCDSCTDSSK